MKKILGATVALAVLAIFISSAQAAINIHEATIQKDQVFIAGDNAQSRQPIFWEGFKAGLGISSTSLGAFSFNTTNLPADCVGRLKIGTEERDVVIKNCTPAAITVIEAGVLKTGQTTSFATGDDGALQKGAASPNPRFTDNGNGTITDNLTELIWLKNANCFSQRTWVNALTAANNLANGQCGLTDGSVAGDWRLPNRNELTSLLNLGTFNPALPSSHLFTNFQSTNYWSSTNDGAGNSSDAWAVSFGFGNMVHVIKTFSFFVTAVRGGS